MKLKAIIIDDEPLARKVIREYIDDTEFLEFCGEAANPVQGISLLNSARVDLIFLDVEMPKTDGINFLKSGKALPAIIFTTAFTEYAVDGYELDIIDFLIKPVTYKRFLKAANKVKEYLQMKILADAHLSQEFDYFFLKCDNKLEKIKFVDILFIEGMSNYILVHTMEKKYLTYLSMRNIEQNLPRSKFIQIHKSYIVSLDSIDSLDLNEVNIKGKMLPISRNYKDEFMSQINRRIIKR